MTMPRTIEPMHLAKLEQHGVSGMASQKAKTFATKKYGLLHPAVLRNAWGHNMSHYYGVYEAAQDLCYVYQDFDHDNYCEPDKIAKLARQTDNNLAAKCQEIRDSNLAAPKI